ncbi:MAG: sulfotransferase [Solirubrobacterales bacterium]|nr:sulfotransferase [Solirubrobacterales bacterium]
MAGAEEQLLTELRSVRASGRRAPDFFIVGHAKSGTTALYQMLQAHPQIYMPAIKETQFLSRALHYREQPQAGPATVRPRTLDAYLSLFAPAAREQRAGEASTDYLRTLATAPRIAALQPQARIVAIFREPVSFLSSLHLQLLQVGIETESDFETAIGLEQERRQGRNVPRRSGWPPALMYSQHVRYVDQLRSYHECFGRERVLVLVYDDFRRENERAVRQVQRFLDVDDSLEIEPAEANPTVRVRSRRAERMLSSVSVGRGPVSVAAKAAMKAVTSERLRRGAMRAVKRVVVDKEPQPPDERFTQELRRRFKGEVVAASEYLGRDLVSLWGYDEV